MKSRSFIAEKQRLHYIPLVYRYQQEIISKEFIDLVDLHGDQVALYESDYQKLDNYLKKNGINNFQELSYEKKIEILEKAEVRCIRYVSDTNLPLYEMDALSCSFDFNGEIKNKSGVALKKNNHQNCVVFYQDHLYVYPKVRSELGNISAEISPEIQVDQKAKVGKIGFSHSSFSGGEAVTVACSLVHNAQLGWILENTTGHYGTRAYQLRPVLERLKDQKIDLKTLTIKTWIPKNPKGAPGANESDYIIHFENADTFLSRTQASLKAIDELPSKKRKIKQLSSALSSPTLDTSEYILLATALLETLLGNRVSLDLQKVKERYARNDYESALKIIDQVIENNENKISKYDNDLISRLDTLAHQLQSNPIKNQSRRYFETKAANFLWDSINEEEYKSVKKFSQFLHQHSADIDGIDLLLKIKSKKDVQETFTMMRKFADKSQIVLSVHDTLRGSSALYSTKDRGEQKQHTTVSYFDGIMKSHLPYPYSEITESISQNRIPDMFYMNDKKLEGYSATRPQVPFVNSLSGTGYTFLVVLHMFVEENKNKDIQQDIINICRAWFATTWERGYHSFIEMQDVFSDPVILNLFNESNLKVGFDLPQAISEQAFDMSVHYAKAVCLKQVALEDLKRVTPKQQEFRTKSAGKAELITSTSTSSLPPLPVDPTPTEAVTNQHELYRPAKELSSTMKNMFTLFKTAEKSMATVVDTYQVSASGVESGVSQEETKSNLKKAAVEVLESISRLCIGFK